jgi:hypothetical protein
LHRSQRYANPLGLPLHEPFETVSSRPLRARPEIEGNPSIAGADAARLVDVSVASARVTPAGGTAAGGAPAGGTVAVGVLVALAVPAALVAVTATRSLAPASAAVTT